MLRSLKVWVLNASTMPHATTKKNPSLAGSAREHLEAGRQYLHEGRYNEAIAELSTAASLDPKLKRSSQPAGRRIQPERASAIGQKNLMSALSRPNPKTRKLSTTSDSRFYQNGNYRAAVDRLKRAAKLAPTDERILNNLGLALCRLGKFDEAYKNFARADWSINRQLEHCEDAREIWPRRRCNQVLRRRATNRSNTTPSPCDASPISTSAWAE